MSVHRIVSFFVSKGFCMCITFSMVAASIKKLLKLFKIMYSYIKIHGYIFFIEKIWFTCNTINIDIKFCSNICYLLKQTNFINYFEFLY